MAVLPTGAAIPARFQSAGSLPTGFDPSSYYTRHPPSARPADGGVRRLRRDPVDMGMGLAGGDGAGAPGSGVGLCRLCLFTAGSGRAAWPLSVTDDRLAHHFQDAAAVAAGNVRRTLSIPTSSTASATLGTQRRRLRGPFCTTCVRAWPIFSPASAGVAIVGNSEAPIVPGNHRGLPHHGRPGRRRPAARPRRQRPGRQPPVPAGRFPPMPASPWPNPASLLCAEGRRPGAGMRRHCVRLGGPMCSSMPTPTEKSISSPGVGNYVTMAKATALAQAILGDAGLARTFVMAPRHRHARKTGSPSRTSSMRSPKTFGIRHWPGQPPSRPIWRHSLGAGRRATA